MAELFLFLGRFPEQRQLLRLFAIVVNVAGGNANQPDFLLERELRKQFPGGSRDFLGRFPFRPQRGQ